MTLPHRKPPRLAHSVVAMTILVIAGAGSLRLSMKHGGRLDKSSPSSSRSLSARCYVCENRPFTVSPTQGPSGTNVTASGDGCGSGTPYKVQILVHDPLSFEVEETGSEVQPAGSWSMPATINGQPGEYEVKAKCVYKGALYFNYQNQAFTIAHS